MKLKTKHRINIALALSVIAIILSIVALTTGGTKVVETGPDAFYLAQAKEAGVKKKTFEKCMASPEIEARVNEEIGEATRIGGQGTPFNVIETPDGKLIPLAGAYPYEAFADIIDRVLAGELTEDEIADSHSINDIRPFNPERDYFKGDADAEITIYEWSDFECPFCARVHPTLQRIVDTYPNVNWVYRNLPLTSIHPQAVPAAKAALCIGEEEGNDAFWQFTDTVFTDQSVLQN